MQVKLIWATENAEDVILYCARVSSNDQNSGKKGLLKYCINHGHWSIFEQANACFEIITSRAISAQILRHRSFSFQEFSQRYAEVQAIEPIEIRKQATKNRQSSTDVFDPVLETISEFNGIGEFFASDFIKHHLEDTQELYNSLIEKGVAKETARMILPMASQTKLYMNGTIRSWIHYLTLRTKEDTQKEHREIALQIQQELCRIAPNIALALEWIKDES